ncbi:MAG: hypothetical protein VX777_02610 [Chlamydiota bacterium]|nr:hypothetical protein [Chlamydiota bacterium]
MSHKKRDWSEYNKTLINRGSLTLWLSPEAMKSWKAKKVSGKKQDEKARKIDNLRILTKRNS